MGGPFVPGLPSQALRASSPKGGAIGRPGLATEGKQKRRKKLFAAKSASCLTRTGDTLINSQVL